MDNPDDVTVYRMGPGCDLGDVEQGKVYIGRVQGFANFGTFVQLNDRVKGLVHKSNIKTKHKERETILVKVRAIRENGNIDLEEVTYPVYTVELVERKSTAVRLAELGTKVGRTVRIEGEIAQIKQTSGPTIFTIVDESGTENAAAFIEVVGMNGIFSNMVGRLGFNSLTHLNRVHTGFRQYTGRVKTFR